MMTWGQLSNIKESYRAEVTEYDNGNGIVYDPYFTWCEPFVLKEQRIILSKIDEKYWKRTHKFRVDPPNSISPERALDAKNGNTMWQEAKDKETKNISVSFDIHDDMDIALWKAI